MHAPTNDWAYDRINFSIKHFSKIDILGVQLVCTPSPGDPIASRDLKLYKKLHIDTSNLCYEIHYSIYNMLDMMSPGILLKTSKNGQFWSKMTHFGAQKIFWPKNFFWNIWSYKYYIIIILFCSVTILFCSVIGPNISKKNFGPKNFFGPQNGSFLIKIDQF